MYLKNKKIPENVTCYVINNRSLVKFLQREKSLPIFMNVGKKYYFVKNKFSQKVFDDEIPFFYRWFSEILEQKGGEEN